MAILFGGPQRPEALGLPSENYVPLAGMPLAHKHQLFGLWLGIVYFNRSMNLPKPVDPPGLGIKPVSGAEREFEFEYENGAWRDLNRALTLEETCYVNECFLGPSICVASSRFSEEPMARIARKVLASPPEMLEIACEHLLLEGALPMLVYDGEFGHAIVLQNASENGSFLRFYDPWPGRSLLCRENNAAGVNALPLGGGWQITSDELSGVMVAFTIRAETWTYLESPRRLGIAPTTA